jgi:hypothetical protein
MRIQKISLNQGFRCTVKSLLSILCDVGGTLESRRAVPSPTDDVKNWMHMFRWIVKLIRDEYEVDESILVRTAVLETDCGLIIEQVEALMTVIASAFGLTFPPGTLDEVLKLDELCMLASWMKGLYRRPEFISDAFEARCRSLNPTCT